MAKICRSYNRMRREFFPELESRFRPQSEVPVALRDDFEEEDDVDVPHQTAQSVLDRCLEEEEKELESPLRMSRRQTPFASPVESVESGEDAEYVEEVSALVPYNDSNVEKKLAPLHEIILGFNGVCGVMASDFATVSEFLQSNDKVCVNLPNLTDERVCDYLLCIPSARNQITMLVSAINRGIPFLMYLPFRILKDYTLDGTVCRLNPIIDGDNAWFLGFFPEAYGSGKFMIYTAPETDIIAM